MSYLLGLGRFIAFFFLISTPLAAVSGSLLWSQEFNDVNGTLPDARYWSAESGDGCGDGNCGWGNSERQYYLPEAASMDGKGKLVFTATRQMTTDYSCYYGGCEWTSARYNTLDKVSFRYGLIEARINASQGDGAWAALWLLGADYPRIRWPRCGELDIGEWLGSKPSTVLGTAHWGDTSGAPFLKGGTFTHRLPLTTGFHVYGLRWSPEEIAWLFDGQIYYTLKKSDVNQGDWPFDHDMFLVINLAMGGELGGASSPSLTTSTYEIDWIHYSQFEGYGEVAFNKNMQ